MLKLMLVLVAVMAVGCRTEPYGSDEGEPSSATDATDTAAATPYGGYEFLSPEDLERGRLDDDWKSSVEIDSTTFAAADSAETWDAIAPETINSGTMHLPMGGDVEGPSVARVQILLDRIPFSPGIIDGRWGKNTEKAVYWMQRREGVPATGQVDSTTYRRLLEQAGQSQPLVVAYTLTEEDVAGPFVQIPEDIYEKARLDRLGYESLLEKLSEQFHAAPELLQQLNPGVRFSSLAAGTSIQVPAVVGADPGASTPIARLIISDRGHYLHAVDSTGQVVYHFPSTLGSSYDPSPQGQYTITSIHEDPWWHYQPDILAHVDDSEPDARIPPGPNNAVGVVWMALSEPHYGIHGTSAPETIGYATSAGCIRLTNWDALFLSRRIEAGTPVEFRDTSEGV